MSTDSVTLQSGDTLTSQATIEDDGEGNVQITEQSMTVAPAGSSPPDAPDPQFGKKLRKETAAVRLQRSKFGVNKTLSKEQRAMAATPFGAQGERLTAGKKLLDAKTEEYKAVTAILGLAEAIWKAYSYPFPEKGIRLIRQEVVPKFEADLSDLKEKLAAAVAVLDTQYASLREQAKSDLGDLYNETDYPASIASEFAIDWDYPNLSPPTYLQDVAPHLYEQQAKRIERQFDDAVEQFEAAMTAELHGMIAHLSERLSGLDDKGHKKVFRDTAISNVQGFFDKFKDLSINSSAELDELVGHCQQIVAGVDPKDLRTDDGFRTAFQSQIAEVEKALDAMLIAKPSRKFFDE